MLVFSTDIMYHIMIESILNESCLEMGSFKKVH